MWKSIPEINSNNSQKVFRKFRDWLSPSCIILLYHRVTKLTSDPQLLAVSPEHFSEHMEVLRKNTRPLPLQQLTKEMRAGSLTRRGVVITFDDGYSDNLNEAKPILERYGFPATVFVPSGNIDTSSEFWWDDLERIFLLPGKLPESLFLSINGQKYHWDMEEWVEYTDEDYRRFCKWNVFELEIPTIRHNIYMKLCELLRNLAIKERNSIVSYIVNWSGKPAKGRKTHRVLSASELRMITEGGLVEIGAHTVNHPVLATISQEEQIHEIRQNKSALENTLSHPINSFSYPFGSMADYTVDTVKIINEAGFDNACSNFPGKVQNGTDFFQLPRFLVRNWSGNEFERQLNDFWLY